MIHSELLNGGDSSQYMTAPWKTNLRLLRNQTADDKSMTNKRQINDDPKCKTNAQI